MSPRRRLGKENTHHVETAQELKNEWFEGKVHVGVTAGASTPDYLIQEVVKAIEGLAEPALLSKNPPLK